jgi:hypothetical protein
MLISDSLLDDRHETVHRRWFRFRHERSPESFLSLRQAVAQGPGYDPDSRDIEEADALIEEGRIAEGYSFLRAMMPGWLLTPRVHVLAAYAYFKGNQFRSAEREIFLSDLIRQGILGTGTGEEARPYLILHGADAADVLARTGPEKVPASLEEVRQAGPRLGYRCGNDPRRGVTHLVIWGGTGGAKVWFATAITSPEPVELFCDRAYGARDDCSLPSTGAPRNPEADRIGWKRESSKI